MATTLALFRLVQAIDRMRSNRHNDIADRFVELLTALAPLSGQTIDELALLSPDELGAVTARVLESFLPPPGDLPDATDYPSEEG